MTQLDYTEYTIDGITYLQLADGKILQVPSGGVDDDVGGTGEDGAGGAGDAGGTGADDDAGAGDSAQDDDDAGDDGAGGRAADDKGEKTTKGLQKRLKSVIGQRNAYRELGTPEELKKLKARVEEYDRYERELDAEEQQRKDEAARKAGEPTVADQNAALDRMLSQRFGEGAPGDFEAFRQTRRMEIQRHTREGLDHLKTLLRECKMKDDDKTVANYERHIGTELLSDNELRAQFTDPVTQKSALTEAFKRVRADLVDPALAGLGASKLEAARIRRASAPSSGGTTASPAHQEKELKPPKELTDPVARQRWWDARIADALREQEEFDAIS